MSQTLGTAIPVLRVASVERSLEYYVGVLGFKVNFQTPGFVSISHDRCNLFLCEGDQGHSGSWLWIGVSDAQQLFEEWTTKGAKIRHPPTNYDWALEMQVEDPDGNILRLGSDSIPGQPRGPWLDMNGTLWDPLEDGGWKKRNS
ncbi:MAG: VOC family protein [Acidobacteriales bacterium]|nr:VOC family protein [Terriglobales bacterium]